MELIVAADLNGGIGRNGGMLYNIPGDLKRFKAITMGKTLLMGRSTFFSLPGKKPLPGRINCVLSRHAAALQAEYPAGEFGPFFYESPEAFLAGHGNEDIMVIGGGEIYALCLPLCRRAYVTEVHASSPADTFFHLDEGWVCTARECTGENGILYDFCIYDRTDAR